MITSLRQIRVPRLGPNLDPDICFSSMIELGLNLTRPDRPDLTRPIASFTWEPSQGRCPVEGKQRATLPSLSFWSFPICFLLSTLIIQISTHMNWVKDAIVFIVFVGPLFLGSFTSCIFFNIYLEGCVIFSPSSLSGTFSWSSKSKENCSNIKKTPTCDPSMQATLSASSWANSCRSQVCRHLIYIESLGKILCACLFGVIGRPSVHRVAMASNDSNFRKWAPGNHSTLYSQQKCFLSSFSNIYIYIYIL